jgi:hypothetical protein
VHGASALRYVLGETGELFQLFGKPRGRVEGSAHRVLRKGVGGGALECAVSANLNSSPVSNGAYLMD